MSSRRRPRTASSTCWSRLRTWSRTGRRAPSPRGIGGYFFLASCSFKLCVPGTPPSSFSCPPTPNPSFPRGCLQVDVANELSDYLAALEDVAFSFDEGATSLNFAEGG